MNFIPNYKNSFRILKGGKISLVVSSFLASTTLTFAAPSGGVVTSGSANISQNGKVTDITQSTQKASINWNKFNIASDETVNFKQPNSSSITLNRVVGNEKSIINGALNSNGQVWIINSNGVLFGKGATINTSGLLATTKDISDADFQAGNYKFTGNSKESVINLGTIDVVNGGSVILAANEVRNEGTIKAIKGKIHLAGADEYTVNLNGNSLVNLIVNKGVLDALVKNSGTIIANGGEVYLTTNAVNELLKGVVNNTGVIEANSLAGITGHVELFAHGGTANINGTINAKGSFVETSGDKVKIDDSFRVKADKWLIDPKDFTIAASGGDITGATLSSNLEDASIEIQSVNGATDGNGDIFVNDTITWNKNSKLTLDADNDIFINKEITATNGKLELLYGQKEAAAGNTSDYHINAKVNLKAGDNFITKLGNDGTETTWTVVTDAGSMQNISLSGNSVLGADIDLSEYLKSNSWNPIGQSTSGDHFSGMFDGLGHNINNLSINDTFKSRVGLFGQMNGANIRNIGLENADVIGKNPTGILAGEIINTKIKNAYTTGKVKSVHSVGGLVGRAERSNIENTYALVTVEADSTNKVGGLVGSLEWSSELKDSYASGKTWSNHGGLVGANLGSTIINSYYDKETNTRTDLVDMSNGKTKLEIVTNAKNNWNKSYWLVSGEEFNGFASNLRLPNMRAFFTPTTTFFESGFGTIDNPYTISNWEQLNSLNNIYNTNYFMNKHYKLLNDLDSSSYGYENIASATANNGFGWTPIGEKVGVFKGTFNGNNHTISDIYMSDSKADNSPTTWIYAKAFFRDIEDATIENLKLNNMTVSKIKEVGGFAYSAKNSILKNLHLTNSNIEGVNVGGIVNQIENSANIDNLKIYGSNISRVSTAGGIFNTVKNSTLKNIYVENTMLSGSNIGGAIRYTENSDIKNLFATEIEINGTGKLGGLIGEAYSSMKLTDSKVKDSTIKGNGDFIGGIVGLVHGTGHEAPKDLIMKNLTSENINIISTASNINYAPKYVGGIAGKYDFFTQGAKEDLSNLIVSGKIGSSTSRVGMHSGGLFGYFKDPWSKIIDSSSQIDLYGSNQVGGLVGYIIATSIDNSSSKGNINGHGSVGGLVGTAESRIYNSYANTNITTNNEITGGLVGWMKLGYMIDSSFSKGTISASKGFIGGLVGFSDSAIKDSYSTVDIKLSQHASLGDVGKLYGYNSKSKDTKTSYASGSITRVDGYVINKIGNPSDTDSTTFWLNDSLDYTIGGSSIENLETYETYKNAGWDIEVDSEILMGTPFLAWEDTDKGYTAKWVIGGKALPLLNYNLNDVLTGFTYDKTLQLPTNIWTASAIFGSAQNDWVLGTDYNFVYDGSILEGFTDAGIYEDISIKLNKRGYRLDTTGNKDGTFKIDQRGLNITADKIYDGNANFVNSGFKNNFTVDKSNILTGDTVTISNKIEVSSKNAGAYDGLVNSSSLLNNKNYKIGDVDITISKKDITKVDKITAKKVYDGTTDATLDFSNTTFAGMIVGDDLTVSTASGKFANKNASDMSVQISVSDISLGGKDKDNYNLLQTDANQYGTITKKDLIVTGITAKDKVYDGYASASISYENIGLEGLIENDDVTFAINNFLIGSFADKNVGKNKEVKISGLYLSGADRLNYKVSSSDATANITPKELSIEGLIADNKIYDGTTNAYFTNKGTLSGLISSDKLNVSVDGTFDNKNVGDAKSVSVSIALENGDNGELASNYFISNTATTTADITKKELTISEITAENKTYDGTTNATIVVANALKSGLVDGDELTLNVTGAFADKNADDSKTVNLTTAYAGADRDNYEITDQSTTTANITQKLLTVAGIVAKDKVYDGSKTANLTIGATSLVGLIDGDTVGGSFDSLTGEFENKNAGENKTIVVSGVSLSGTDASNYKILGADAKASITKKELTVSSATVDSKVYDGNKDATVANLDTVVGLVGSEKVTIGASGVFADKNAENAKDVDVSFTLADGTNGGLASNYFVSNETKKADITKKSVTLNYTAENKVYDGATIATVTKTDNGFIAGDTIEVTQKANFVDKNAEAGKTVNITDIALSGDDALNYEVASSSATASADITQKALSVSGITAKDKVYDGTTNASIIKEDAALVGLIDGDTVDGSFDSLTGEFENKNAGEDKSIVVSGVTLSGADAANYTVSGADAKATISKKEVTLGSLSANNKVYDSLEDASIDISKASISGILGSDGLTISSVDAKFSDKNVADDKAVTVSSVTFSGADSLNYMVKQDQITGLKANITPLELKVTGLGLANKVYDGNKDATLATGNIEKIVGDDVSVKFNGKDAYSSKDAGSYTDVGVSLTMTGDDAKNYFIKDDGAFVLSSTITQKELGVSVSKTYDGSTNFNSDFKVSKSDIIEGDSVAITGSATVSSKNAGSYTSFANSSGLSLDNSNYKLGSDVEATITKKELALINFKAQDKFYDGNRDAKVSADGIKTSDILTGENVTFDMTLLAGLFEDEKVGIDKIVSIKDGLTLAGADAANYKLADIATAAIKAKPTPKPEQEKDVKDAQKVITTITNQTATTVNLPTMETSTTPNNSGRNTNISFSQGENQMLVSSPIEGQATTRVSLSEARQMQIQNGGSGEEVIVPLSNSSIIQLVDGGVNLPSGVEQEFYLADANTQEEK